MLIDIPCLNQNIWKLYLFLPSVLHFVIFSPFLFGSVHNAAYSAPAGFGLVPFVRVRGDLRLFRCRFIRGLWLKKNKSANDERILQQSNLGESGLSNSQAGLLRMVCLITSLLITFCSKRLDRSSRNHSPLTTFSSLVSQAHTSALSFGESSHLCFAFYFGIACFSFGDSWRELQSPRASEGDGEGAGKWREVLHLNGFMGVQAEEHLFMSDMIRLQGRPFLDSHSDEK